MEAEESVMKNPVKMSKIRQQLEAELAAKTEKKRARKEAKKAKKEAKKVNKYPSTLLFCSVLLLCIGNVFCCRCCLCVIIVGNQSVHEACCTIVSRVSVQRGLFSCAKGFVVLL